MLTILTNSLMRYAGEKADKNKYIYRVIFQDTQKIVLFNVSIGEAANPQVYELALINEKISSGEIELLTSDPLAPHSLATTNLSSSEQEKVDKTFQLVNFLLYDNEGDFRNEIFKPGRKRRGLLREAANKFGVCERQAMRSLKRFWRLGMSKQAMRPLYENCGGRGTHHNHHGRKMGRPVQTAQDPDVKPLFSSEEMREQMAAGLFEFFTSKTTLTEVYQKILIKYYRVGYQKVDGFDTPILVDSPYLLTEAQLRHFYETEFSRDPEKFLRGRLGNRVFEQNFRAMLGNPTSDAHYPGGTYQIDSTSLDIFLVLSSDRAIPIGCPTVYMIMDVFSRAICGFCVAVESPSWQVALRALYMAIQDKKKFCAEYGIEISDENWPCRGLPQRFLADNAEMKTKISDALVSLGVTISTAAAYRPDWKGSIEAYLRGFNQVVHPLAGGRIKIDKRRGLPDPRLDSCLTIEDLYKILIQFSLYYNNFKILKSYASPFSMVSDGIPPIPNLIWKWGELNRSTGLRFSDPDVVIKNLLPVATAKISSRGFTFRGLPYHMDEKHRTIEQRLAIFARSKGKSSVSVHFDPCHLEKIYYQDAQGGPFIPVLLSEPYQTSRLLHEDELRVLQDMQHNRIRSGLIHQQLQARVKYLAIRDQIVSDGKKQTEAAIKNRNLSKQHRLACVRAGRQTQRKLSPPIGAPFSTSKGDLPVQAPAVLPAQSKDSPTFDQSNLIDNFYEGERDG